MNRMLVALAAVLLGPSAAGCGGPAPDITPIARAARDGDIAAIEALARDGHDVNAADRGGNHWTPLLHAIHKRQPKAVEALLAAGADVHRAAGGVRADGDLVRLTPLMMAVGNGQTGIVRRLLAAGADPRRDGAGIFALAVAGGALSDIENPLLGGCHTEIVRALLKRDPTLTVPSDARGHLSLLFARLNGCTEVVQLARTE
jgi:ankyrin repeat protein